MTAVGSSQVPALKVFRAMSADDIMRKCREIGAVFVHDGTEKFLVADVRPAGAVHPHGYDEAGLRRFCSRMH